MKPSYVMLALFSSAMVASYVFGYTPAGIGVVFLLVSVVTFGVYARDKRAAGKGAWRVPERTLHLMSLLCGWPGAVVAQQSLRHKTQKVSFRVVFWASVAINAAFIAWLHAPSGAGYLKSYVNRMEGFVYSNVSSEPLRNLTSFLTAYRRRA